MTAPRVSDERINRALEAYHKKTIHFNGHFVVAVLEDLKDARAQLKTHQEMRALYNKEPE